MTSILKEKQPTAVAISIAAECKPRTHYHPREARETDAPTVEINQSIADAVLVHRGAGAISRGSECLGTRAHATRSWRETMRHLFVVSGALLLVGCGESERDFMARMDASEQICIEQGEHLRKLTYDTTLRECELKCKTTGAIATCSAAGDPDNACMRARAQMPFDEQVTECVERWNCTGEATRKATAYGNMVVLCAEARGHCEDRHRNGTGLC